MPLRNILEVLTMVNSTAIPISPYAVSGSSDAIILVIIVIFLSVRFYRGMRGQKFSSRIYLLPIIYIAFTVITLFTYPATLFDIAATLIAIPIGIVAGLLLGGMAKVFDNNGVTLYKRSPFIMGVWIVAYIARVALPFIFPATAFILFIVGAILAFTSGMLLGETLHLRNKYKAHTDAKLKGGNSGSSH
jgi:hypothetical protein